VRALFVGLYGEQLKAEHSSVVNCDKFGSYFDRQMQELEGASDSGAPSIKVSTPPSSTDTESADERAPAPVLQKPQRPLYDTSADSTPVPTPDTSRPTTPAQSLLLTGKSRPAGSKLSRRDKKKVTAMSSAPMSSGDEASSTRKGKGGAKKNRTWGEFGAEEDDGTVLDYSQADLRDRDGESEAMAEIKQDTWGRKTKQGEFVLKDLDEEMDAIIAAQNAKKDKETLAAAAPGGIVGSSLGVIGGLFRNVVGGKTLTKEDLAKPLKGMEEHLLKKNVAREAAVRLCDSVERDLVGMKTPNFTSTSSTPSKSSTHPLLTFYSN
jgi:signal recognition particle receptor subunit alpha